MNQKPKLLHVRGSEKIEKIGDYTVEEEVKYLGGSLGGRGRDIFRAEKIIWLKKSMMKANEVISQVKKAITK